MGASLKTSAGERSRLGTRLACETSQVRARALPKFLPTKKRSVQPKSPTNNTPCRGSAREIGSKVPTQRTMSPLKVALVFRCRSRHLTVVLRYEPVANSLRVALVRR